MAIGDMYFKHSGRATGRYCVVGEKSYGLVLQWTGGTVPNTRMASREQLREFYTQIK
jgi:hypothetical protein